ncbi:MAG: sporulation protein YtfJ [Clostridia bacterium]|nr:sporulation protein YtfJ [Clostridia bacterium]
MENESSIKELISESLDRIRTIIDADTVVGRQIVTPSGTVIIPISKVSMGFASGGLDLPNDSGKKPSKNFGGGGGTGVTVSPIGFLTVYPDGKVEMLNMTQEKAGPIEQIAEILDHAPDVISRVKGLFVNKDADQALEDAEVLEEEYARRLEEELALEEATLSKKELKKRRKEEKKALKI